MRILVTGGAGFIGSHLVDRLVKEHDVYVFDDYSGGKKENENPKATYYTVDCRRGGYVDDLISGIKPEIVYHLAANAAENKAQFSPIDITSRNYDGFIKVLTPFIKYGGKKFIFTSSAAVYGNLPSPVSESDTPHPEDLYGITKLAIENSLKIMANIHGFEYVILRPHNVYGPRQNMSDPYRNVVAIFINALLQNKPYYVYDEGRMLRCFSYVDDIVNALYKCSSSDIKDMTFNIGSDIFYSIKELSDTLQEISGIFIDPISLPARPHEVKEILVNHTLAKKFLRFKETVSFKEGLIRTWEWAKKQGAVIPKYQGIEIDSPLLPENWRNNEA